MKSLFFRTTLLFSACLAFRLAAADAPPAEFAPTPVAPAPAPAVDDQKKLEQAIRERLAEHALKKASREATTTAPADTPAGPVTPAKDATTAASSSKEDATTQMQRVEVNKSRITDLAIKLHEKDLEIAREKKNATPTTLDTALNDPDVSHKLSIFGGSSSEDRARVAEERVGLLEAEKDLIEEIAQAKTRDEKDELEKTLNDLKAMRRELEHAPRDERK